METIETYEYKGYKVVISYDEYSDSPTEWGNFTIIENKNVERSDELDRALKTGKAFWIDKYEHSGVAFRLADEVPTDPWDTTLNYGIIEFTDEYATNADDYEGRKEMARQDLETYTHWANGDVYCSYVYELNPTGEDDDEMIDGSGGIYGYEYAKEMAESTIDRYAPPRSSKYAVNAGRLHI